MKKNIINLSIGFIISIFASCSLNQQPISEIGDGAFYANASEINAAVVGCYSGLQGPLAYEWRFTETRSDNTRFYTATTSSVDNTAILNYDQAKIETTDDNIYKFWLATYNNIARCNSVLAHSAVVEDKTLRSQYEAEARFIRAYHYFTLVRLFGPVFIVDERISAKEALSKDRASVEKVYEFITTDLTFCIDNLPAQYDDANLGRVTAWAAKGMLAKVKVTKGEYTQQTADLLYDVIHKSGYTLLPSYESVFDIQNELNKEILFTVRYTSGGIGLGSPFGNYFGPYNSGDCVINGNAKGWNNPTDDLVSAYEKDDLRRDVSLGLNYVDKNGKTVENDKGGRYVKKFLSPVLIVNDGDKDWPILRMADLILLYAEVLNETDGIPAALPYVNQIRNRAGLPDLVAAKLTSPQAMRMAIEQERRIELAFENHRWYDLVRTGRVLDVMNTHYNTEAYYSGPNIVTPILTSAAILLPIPQREIDIKADIPQNVGY